MKNESIAIIIPARYGSTRFPGKPLAMIAGKSMLQRVYEIASKEASTFQQTSVYITTDDDRIKDHAASFTDNIIMTSSDCLTGSSRVLRAADKLTSIPDIILNLQGDVPLIPGHFISELIQTLIDNQRINVATPITPLTWEALNELSEWKKAHPFSGTTVTIDQSGKALWFSKNIIPAIRKPEPFKKNSPLSPVFRHIGLYAYRYKALKTFIELDEGLYEKLEGLEQLRFLENHIPIQTVTVSYGNLPAMSGVDTPDDLKLASELLAQYGDPLDA